MIDNIGPVFNNSSYDEMKEMFPMRQFMAITKALSDENRVRILLMLRQEELCVCQIVSVLGLSASTVSKHLSILHQAQLLDSTRRGKWVYYRLAGAQSPRSVQEALQWVQGTLGTCTEAQTLDEKLAQLSKSTPEELLCTPLV
jgi:ArsR family transcriptional regulator, arsenate/arsenite/antimonite-responsive transcriptional repressor